MADTAIDKQYIAGTAFITLLGNAVGPYNRIGIVQHWTCDIPTVLSTSMRQRRHKLWAAGAKIGLIDYGQSKQLPLPSKLAFAQLIHDLDEGDEGNILAALQGLGVRLQAGSPALASRMAYGMFDTRGR